jgi:hypothetical protein
MYFNSICWKICILYDKPLDHHANKKKPKQNFIDSLPLNVSGLSLSSSEGKDLATEAMHPHLNAFEDGYFKEINSLFSLNFCYSLLIIEI